jgi:hypothetical protein
MKNIEFLKSLRFWSIVLIALVGYAEAKGYIGESERTLIWTIAGGFGIVRTVDRVSDKVLEGKKIESETTTVNIPKNVSSVSATTVDKPFEDIVG